MISRVKWNALKKQSPAVPIPRNQKIIGHYVKRILLSLITNLQISNYTLQPKKKGKISKVSIMNPNFHLNFMIKSNLSQMFGPARFVFAKIFTRMTNTTPCSIGRSAPFQLFFVSSTTRCAPPLNCPHRPFINARRYFFKSKSNLNTLRRRVYHVVFSVSFMSWCLIQLFQ